MEWILGSENLTYAPDNILMNTLKQPFEIEAYGREKRFVGMRSCSKMERNRRRDGNERMNTILNLVILNLIQMILTVTIIVLLTS